MQCTGFCAFHLFIRVTYGTEQFMHKPLSRSLKARQRYESDMHYYVVIFAPLRQVWSFILFSGAFSTSQVK